MLLLFRFLNEIHLCPLWHPLNPSRDKFVFFIYFFPNLPDTAKTLCCQQLLVITKLYVSPSRIRTCVVLLSERHRCLSVLLQWISDVAFRHKTGNWFWDFNYNDLCHKKTKAGATEMPTATTGTRKMEARRKTENKNNKIYPWCQETSFAHSTKPGPNIVKPALLKHEKGTLSALGIHIPQHVCLSVYNRADGGALKRIQWKDHEE